MNDEARRQAALDSLLIANWRAKIAAVSIHSPDAEIWTGADDFLRLVQLAEEGATARLAALASPARGLVEFVGATHLGNWEARISFTNEDALRAAGALILRDVALMPAPPEEALGSNSVAGDRQ